MPFRLIAALVLFGCCCAANAQSALRGIEVAIAVQPDGSAIVSEQLTTAYIEGEVTRSFRKPGEARHLKVIRAESELGEQLAWRERQSSDELSVTVLPRGFRSTIVYWVRDAVEFGNGYDRFLWSVAGGRAAVPDMTVRVDLPRSDNGIAAQAILTGAGSRNGRIGLRDAIEGKTFVWYVPDVYPGAALHVDVALPSGVLQRPPLWRRAARFIADNPILLLPLLTWIAMWLLWHFKPADANAWRSVAPQYGPPDGLTPAEAGTLMDDRVDPRDVGATLVDLASRGFLRIEEADDRDGRPDFKLTLAKQAAEWHELEPHEQTMLFHAFYGGQWTQLSSLQLRLPSLAPAFRQQVIASLRRKGMYRIAPGNAQIVRQTALGILIALLVVAQVFGAVSVVDTPWLALVSATISALIVWRMSRDVTAKTLKGMRTAIAVKGFAEFLQRVEGDRLDRAQHQLFEKYVSYAMALGVEHQWTGAFAEIAIERPDWYEISQDAFEPQDFGNRLNVFAATAVAGALASSSRVPKSAVEQYVRAVRES